jgi:hypothetical protein
MQQTCVFNTSKSEEFLRNKTGGKTATSLAGIWSSTWVSWLQQQSCIFSDAWHPASMLICIQQKQAALVANTIAIIIKICVSRETTFKPFANHRIDNHLKINKK